MRKVKHCIGAISYCDSSKNPERFDILKNTFAKLSEIKRDDNYIFVWDNGSSDDVKDFLLNCGTFDDVYFSQNNLYTNGLIAAINLKARQLQAEYVSIIADDYLVFRPEAIHHCVNFLDQNKDCGYVRMLKFELENIHLYDKILSHTDRDVPNCQRQFNYVNGKQLEWEYADYPDRSYTFFKNNYHWSEFSNVCRADVFDMIVPKKDCLAMSGVEKTMMYNYHNLEHNGMPLKTGVLNGGAFTHDQRDFGDNSLRVTRENTWQNKMVDSNLLLETVNQTIGTDFKSL